MSVLNKKQNRRAANKIANDFTVITIHVSSISFFFSVLVIKISCVDVQYVACLAILQIK